VVQENIMKYYLGKRCKCEEQLVIPWRSCWSIN